MAESPAAHVIKQHLRFFDGDCDIREEFVDFIYTDRITGEVMASKLRAALDRYGIDLIDCRGQGMMVLPICPVRVEFRAF